MRSIALALLIKFTLFYLPEVILVYSYYSGKKQTKILGMRNNMRTKWHKYRNLFIYTLYYYKDRNK